MAGDPLTPGQELAEKTWPELEKLSPDERKMFFSTLGGEWCIHCGNQHPGYPCQCQNDE